MRRIISLACACALLLALASVTASGAKAAAPAPGSYARTTTALNERAGPGMGYRVLRVIPSGGSVYVSGGPYYGGWYRITYAGTGGYVWGSYIYRASGASGGSSGGSARYATTTSALNLRAGPGASYRVLRVIPYHGRVRVVGGPYNGWYKVVYGGTTGYASGYYLSRGGGGSTGGPSNGGSPSQGYYAYATVDLNLRYGPGFGYQARSVIPYGARVYVSGGPYSGYWYRVAYAGASGYVYGSYLSRSSSGYRADYAVWHGSYPYRWIDINLSTQSMAAFQRGTLVRWTYVTTGNYRYPSRRTPTGVYHVLAKVRDHWFISPWPPGSFFYYPPSKSNYDLMFRYGGYYVHDAPWRHHFGPGSNMGYGSPGGDYTGSHGCVNTPYSYMQWLYYWASVGTPIVIHY